MGAHPSAPERTTDYVLRSDRISNGGWAVEELYLNVTEATAVWRALAFRAYGNNGRRRYVLREKHSGREIPLPAKAGRRRPAAVA